MVGVELPKCAEDHVEVLVAEVIPNHLDVVVVRQLLPRLNHRGLIPAKAIQMDAADVLAVVHEEDSADHGVSIAVLEFLGLTEEVQAWVGQQDGREEDAEVLSFDPIVVLLLHDVKEAQDEIVRLYIALGPADDHLLGDGDRAGVQQCRLGLGGGVHDVVEDLDLVEDGHNKVLGQFEDIRDNWFQLGVGPDALRDVLLHKNVVDLLPRLLRQCLRPLPLRPPEARDDLGAQGEHGRAHATRLRVCRSGWHIGLEPGHCLGDVLRSCGDRCWGRTLRGAGRS
mmetsp:Transcript_138708/g.386804  ORF Transcript_138708/g.386804 Transcript_138708/m.386804 type:complete len:282 (-) Transcript_138708:340-1185(-)